MAKSDHKITIRNREYDKFHVELGEVPEKTYRSIDYYTVNQRRKLQANGECTCPKQKLWRCDLECCYCEFRSFGNTVSYNADLIRGTAPSPEEIVIKKAFWEAFYQEFEKLTPEQKAVFNAVKKYRSERKAAEALGKSRSYVQRRMKKIEEIFAKDLKEWRGIDI